MIAPRISSFEAEAEAVGEILFETTRTSGKKRFSSSSSISPTRTTSEGRALEVRGYRKMQGGSSRFATNANSFTLAQPTGISAREKRLGHFRRCVGRSKRMPVFRFSSRRGGYTDPRRESSALIVPKAIPDSCHFSLPLSLSYSCARIPLCDGFLP